MKKLWIPAIFLLFFCHSAFSQDHMVKGKIIDDKTDAPLAFVNILVNESKYGSSTDIDGKFRVFSHDPIRQLKISYVGYQDTTVKVNGQDSLLIKLKQIRYELPEVAVLPGKNPAHRIIRNVIENKDINDPEKLSSFSYTAYDKMYFTIDRDTLAKLDSLIPDTSMQRIRKFIDEKHFFMMETVTERKYMAPERNHEKVTASRISGFKDPIIVFMISQMQSTSFYDDIIEIMGENYINPISKGSLNKYFFLLRDTAYTAANDTVFIISYRPRKGTHFDGMKGFLSINSNGWAIQNVIARPAESGGMLEIKIQQMYRQVDGKHWFPVQLNTDLKMRFVQVSESDVNLNMIGVGKSYIKDIVLNPDLVAREFSNIEVEIEPDAYRRKEDYWGQYRADSLTAQEKRTYTFIDSIGEEYNFDEIAGTVDALMTGEIPWGHINLDMDKFIRYNDYEGFYLGLGAHTNDLFSRHLKVGGFWGYGFKDKTAKYGVNADLNLWRRHDLKIGFDYSWNATESGGVHFFDESDNLLRPENFRELLIKRMNMTENISGFLQFKALKYLTVNLSMARQYKEAFGDYQFIDLKDGQGFLRDNFVFTEAGISLRYAYKETFLQTARSKVSLGTDYPIIWLQYHKGLSEVFDGQFDYDRFDLKIEESFYSKYLGKTTLRLMAGYIDGDIPYCNLFNGNGSYRKFTLNAPFSFATMRMNEFLSNRYVAFYFYHDFDNLIFGGKRFKPELAIATNVAFGALNNPGDHLNVNFNTLEKGYYESGFLVNKLLDLKLYSLGLGAFYRYGPYSFDKAWDNVALRLSLKFPF
ncbi:MAG: DUF5686 and carboxypeptidase regulatory-like domain-containing protein [Bacteroidales bacterium]|nr:DUF5686 and carboxypeptidase regulatory-like domain-containing protein [Bacteroidales bacterium]MCF8388396.1 DUF5686 and carboxypeptidase regulatory-like domain-containing protein [Bacteroidales bacterium]MCF8399235.1 DUF5686 and carboxypeptidase regulatory-like domain-containing protein [Bacteroidales bacterium]